MSIILFIYILCITSPLHSAACVTTGERVEEISFPCYVNMKYENECSEHGWLYIFWGFVANLSDNK